MFRIRALLDCLPTCLVLAFSPCRVSAKVLTSVLAAISPSVSKFILAFGGRRLSGSMSTIALPLKLPIVSLIVSAFSLGGMSASELFSLSHFASPSMWQVS